MVAGEISELASRVRSSSEEVGGLIRTLRHESENAAGAIEAGTASVASGVVLAGEARESLEVITTAARASGERSQEILDAVREHSKAATHVVDTMERVSHGLVAIRRATEEQSRGHEAVANGTRLMRDVAQQLRTTTAEQARGVKQIGGSADGVREAIHALVESQTAACRTSAGLLEQLAAQARRARRASPAWKRASAASSRTPRPSDSTSRASGSSGSEREEATTRLRPR